MLLKVAAGRLDIQTDGVRFWLSDGANTVSCFVTHFVLQDLGSHHLSGTGSSDLQAFSELLPEIEQLANAKYDAGRTEDNGEISIGTADLLRRGLQCPGAHLDRGCTPSANSGIEDGLLEALISQLGRISSDGTGTSETKLRETVSSVDKNRPRRKPAAVLFRDGLHLRTPISSNSRPSRSDHDHMPPRPCGLGGVQPAAE